MTQTTPHMDPQTARASAMARRVVIHCGVQKTGSTALHHFLGANAGRLAGQLDVYTPTPKTPVQKLGPLAIKYSLNPTPENEALFANGIETVRDILLAGGDAPVLISQENLAGAAPGKDGEHRFFPMLPAIMTLLAKHMAPLTPEFALYTRSMDDWKSSLYGQIVHSDWYTKTEDDFRADVATIREWDDLIARLRTALGAQNLHVFALEDEADPRRPGAQLLSLCGLSDAKIAELAPQTRKSNSRINKGALEFIRQINALGLEPHARTDVVRLAVQNQMLFHSN